MKKGFLLVPILALSFSAKAELYQIHILKPGETLSELLYSMDYKPLYGPGNWVEKTLELNHLSSPSDERLKKGFPVILPKRKTDNFVKVDTPLVKDTVSTKKAATIRHGLFGNRISDHQDIYVELDYRQKSYKLESTTLQQKENFGVGFKVNGTNDYQVNQFTYNFNGSAFLYSHGSGVLTDKSSISTSNEPSYKVNFDIQAETENLPFAFGPSFQIDETSRTEQKGDLFINRRDRLSWIGFKVSKNHFVNHLEFQTSFSYHRSQLHQDLNSKGDFNASQLEFSGNVNLTDDYYAGIKFSSTSYRENIGINSDRAVGLNLSYNLK